MNFIDHADQVDETHKKIDLIFQGINEIFSKNNFEKIDFILEEINPENYSNTTLLSILVSSRWDESKIDNYKNYYDKISHLFKNEMLKGLEPKN